MEPTPPRRILIVEDDPLTARCYQAALKPHAAHFSWRWEATGEGALACLRRERADAVLLDWDLPGMSGLAVLQEIRAEPETVSLPVIMVTGRDDADSRDRALECGATGFHSKPLEPDELARWLLGLPAKA